MNLKPIVLTAVALVALAACGTPRSISADQSFSNVQLDRYQKNQPAPSSDFSQFRQTVIDIENARIHSVATTTFFFNLGVQAPIKSCPSIGFPVPSTAQLTNPQQAIIHGNAAGAVLGQIEPNGVYTGDSTGTYIVCVAANGKKYVTYWEGNVQTEGGPAHWDKDAGIVLDGAPTVLAK